MKHVMQGLLCVAGMHDLQFVGKDGEDLIYRCKCGLRKVEHYSLNIDRIGWHKKPRGGGSAKFTLMGRKSGW